MSNARIANKQKEQANAQETFEKGQPNSEYPERAETISENRPEGASAIKSGPANKTDAEKLAIYNRRKRVSSLLARSRTEQEIAEIEGVNQSTISRDIQALREESAKFVPEVAKSDVLFSYRQSLDGMHEIKRSLWDKQIAVANGTSTLTFREKLDLDKMLLLIEEALSRLIKEGPVFERIKNPFATF